MRKQEELIATYCYETHRFGQDRIIGKAMNEQGEQITVTGDECEGHPQRNYTYRMSGIWRDYRGTPQFQFNALAITTPQTPEAIISYLRQVPGISPVMARKLTAEYGKDAVAKVRTEWESLVDKYRGFTEAKAKEASHWLREREKFEGSLIEVTALLSDRGMPKRLPMRIVERWRTRAATLIQRNPYLLMSFKGVGFKTADRLWLDLKKPANTLKRQAYFILHLMQSDSSGDTWFNDKFLRTQLQINVHGSDFEKAIKLLLRARKINVAYSNDQGQVDWFGRHAWYATADDYSYEIVLANNLARLSNSVSMWPSAMDLPDLSESQREELATATRSPVGIFCGGPGTGKTHSTARLVKSLLVTHGEAAVALVTPTGKAAVRASEAMAENGVPLRAQTIYRALGPGVDESGNWTFEFGPARPMPYKFVIVDETSMCDTWLLVRLIESCAAGTHVLFVGDVNQLPPVGRGAPLRDMIEAGIEHGMLTEPRRNSGEIVLACHAIREGNRFDFGGNLQQWSGSDNPGAQQECLLDLLLKLKEDQGYGQHDVQVIVATNDGPVGRKSLNNLLKTHYNERLPQHGWKFSTGDKVICLKNGAYRAEYEGTDPTEFLETSKGDRMVRVANGDMGEVIETTPSMMRVQLRSPDRRVNVSRDAVGSGEEPKWDLGYAVTCHKMQGSQAKVCVIIADGARGSRLTNREWWYTALSRPKEICYVIGPESAIWNGIRSSGIHVRKTCLKDRIVGAMRWEEVW